MNPKRLSISMVVVLLSDCCSGCEAATSAKSTIHFCTICVSVSSALLGLLKIAITRALPFAKWCGLCD